MKYKQTKQRRSFRGKILKRIVALEDNPRYSIKAGDLGGWIECMENLSKTGECWIKDNAVVFGLARVEEDALIKDESIVGFGRIHDSSVVSGKSEITKFGFDPAFSDIFSKKLLISGDSHIVNSNIQGEYIEIKDADLINTLVLGNSRLQGPMKLTGCIVRNSGIKGNYNLDIETIENQNLDFDEI